MKYITLFMLTQICLISCSITPDVLTISSPDSNASITIGVDTDQDNKLFFSITYLGDEVILPSEFELHFKDMPPFSDHLNIERYSRKSVNEKWNRVWGKSETVRDNYNEITIYLRESEEPFRKLNFIARAYNDGIAFRYQIPEQVHFSQFTLQAEHTQFKMGKDYKVWASFWQRYVSAQEQEFKETSISSFTTNDIIGTPVLLEFDRGWGALLEANLTDWAGMFLTAGQDSSTIIKTRLSPHPSFEDAVVVSEAPRYSPWRLLMLGESPGDLIESDILHNLNEPNALGDVSWVTPGRSAWDWWWCGRYAPDAGFELGPNTETMKYFIDFASEMGWEYQLVDWQWYGEPFAGSFRVPNPDADITTHTDQIDIPYLVEYAKERNVRLMVWLNWWHVDRQLEEAFALYEDWGIAGVKIDFMDRNDQEMVNYYHRVLKKAAEHKLIVNFHGSYQPTGIDRTFPNFLTREGVLGNEYNKWSSRVTATHCLHLPFTRMLGGQMDYTPGGFLHVRHDQFEPVGGNAPAPKVRGTRCFQLAMPVVYESALTVFCDSPYNYRGEAGLDFYKVVPTTWDETRVIDGYPGEFVAIARRNGENWFFGAMTNEEERSLDIDLSFLGNHQYLATIYADAPDSNTNPSNLVIEKMIVTSSNTINIRMAEAGGCAIYFEKQ
jgi:alpha-glucosidase